MTAKIDLRPAGVIKFQRHAGDDEQQEARHDHEMQEPLERHEAREPFAVLLRRDFRLAELFRVMLIQPDRAHQPGKGVEAEERERADEQAGHRQEHDVQQRIILRVHRVGVRPVFGEFRRRARMTLLAGGEDVGLGKMRQRVGRRQHVVKTVAVVAGGDFRRGRSACRAPSPCRGRFRNNAPAGRAWHLPQRWSLMALKLLPVGLTMSCARVAVSADRPARVAFREQLAVDALVVGLLDAEVAFAAGFGDVARG